MTVSTQTTISLRAEKFEPLELKFANHTANVGIIGLGYVGLPLALLFADAGFPVTGFDVDAQKVEKLSRGESYIYRVPSSEIQLARTKRFSATADYSDIGGMDAVIICVPTPLNEQREPDLSYITNTAEAITPHLRAGQLIVLESTTYPGTTEEVLVPILEQIAGWQRPRIRQLFESYGFLIQDWDRVQTDWITLRPVGAEVGQAAAVDAS